MSFDKPWFDKPTELTIDGEEWRLGRLLNFGAEGQTYLMTRQRDNKEFAAKFLGEKDSSEVKLVQALPSALVHHQNFVTYEMVVLGVRKHFWPAYDILVMELIPNGELFDVIVSANEVMQHGGSLSANTSRRFTRDIIRGMAQCYRSGVTHRDLKPENLLIDRKGSVVIVDLGHAKYDASGAGPITTFHSYGTKPYAAPEVFKVGEWPACPACCPCFGSWSEARHESKYQCESADVWSVGVIAFQFHTAQFPFDHRTTQEDAEGENNERLWEKLERRPHMPQFPLMLKQFINTLWQRDPSKRPLFAELELAIGGDAGILEKYPGLRWLAWDVNERDFIDELRARCPQLMIDSFPRAPAVASNPGPVARLWGQVAALLPGERRASS